MGSDRQRHGMGIAIGPARARGWPEERIDRLQRARRGCLAHPSGAEGVHHGCTPRLRAESAIELPRALNAPGGPIGHGGKRRLVGTKVVLEDPKQATRTGRVPGRNHLARCACEQRGRMVQARAVGKRGPQRRAQERCRRPSAGMREDRTPFAQIRPHRLPACTPLPTPAQSLAPAPGTDIAQGTELVLELADVPVTGGPHEQGTAQHEDGHPDPRAKALLLEHVKQPTSNRRRQGDGAVALRPGRIVRAVGHVISVAGSRPESWSRTRYIPPWSGSEIDWRWAIRPMESGNST